MSPSNFFIEEAYKAQSDYAVFILLEFTFSGGTVRYCNNNESIVSNGQTYSPMYFEMDLPDNTEERLPDVRIVIDNVDLAMAQLCREHEGDNPTVKVSLVTSLDWDTVELGPINLTIKNAGNRDPETLELNCGVEDLLNRSALPIIYSPGVTPGVILA